jgi:3-hydroxymyristoyl/3-hydroxydecanoyl-(acyl carrier protein) dehydratase
VREVRVHGKNYTAQFEGTDASFVVTGYFPDRSLVSPGVLISGTMLQGLLHLDLYYNGAFGQKFSDHSVGGELRFGF